MHPLLRRCGDCGKLIAIKNLKGYEIAYSEDERDVYCRACTEKAERLMA